MKYLITLLSSFFLILSLLSFDFQKSNIEISKVDQCGTIKIQLSSKFKFKQNYKILLEQELVPNVWKNIGVETFTNKTAFIKDLNPGKYRTTLLDRSDQIKNGKSTWTTEAFISNDLIINCDRLTSKASVSLFPNITNSSFKFENLTKLSSFQIVDMYGKVILNDKASNGQSIDVSDMPNGKYLVQLLDPDYSKIALSLTILK